MKNSIIKNTISLYGLTMAKMIIPLITLPYLTRVLSKDCYGAVAYVKAIMQYMQMIVDFGFLLSGTKDIVNARLDEKKLAEEIGDIFAAKLLLSVLAGLALTVLVFAIPLLKKNALFCFLSYVVVVLTCFLFDYLFRGIEEMQVITVRFVVMKSIATALTFVFVKDDADILMIPILDIVGSLAAIALVFTEINRRKIRIAFTGIRSTLKKIKESAVYFLSDVATTAFGALNTVVIGILLTESEVADWSLCYQLVGAVQSLYSPITGGIYPEMVKNKDINIVRKTLKIFLPLIACGCIFTFFIAKYVLLIVGGKQYASAAPLLRLMIPVMFLGFLSKMFGWPTLGAIGKIKETTSTTVITAVVQTVGLLALSVMGHFTLYAIAVLRDAAEVLLFSLRFYWFRKYKDEYFFTEKTR